MGGESYRRQINARVEKSWGSPTKASAERREKRRRAAPRRNFYNGAAMISMPEAPSLDVYLAQCTNTYVIHNVYVCIYARVCACVEA